MIALLNPRLLIGLALVAALAFSHFTAYRKGKHAIRTEWQASIAVADAEARRRETLRQSRVDEAQAVAAARESRLRSAVVAARNESRGLRDDLDATQRWASQSLAASNKALGVTTGLLEQCTALYLGVSEEAARADSEARELRDGWPR